MNRTILVLFSSLLIGVSFLGVTNPANSLEWLFTVNPAMQALRFSLAALLLIYAFRPADQGSIGVGMMRVLGVTILGMTFMSIWMPELYGPVSIEAQPLDLVLLIEAGIIALLASLEPRWDPAYDYRLVRSSDSEPRQPREYRFPWQRKFIPTFMSSLKIPRLPQVGGPFKPSPSA